MSKFGVPLWRQIPVFRLLVALIFGIILQWYVGISLLFQGIFSVAAVLLILSYSLLSASKAYRLRWVQGIAATLLLFTCGCFITHQKDIRHNAVWAGGIYRDSSPVLVTIQEPLVEKTKSYKALASVDAVLINNKWQPVAGKMLLYFKKDSVKPNLVYGSKIMFEKPLQPITNSGNPGSFDYQRYSAFHDIYHQCFLQQEDYRIMPWRGGNGFQQWLFDLRSWVIAALRNNIFGQTEQGVAEALLIGYRDDLDKNLVQAYSNTGVVHIIAISGLHLGMIYGSLLLLFRPFKNRRWVKWAKLVVIFTIIWIFSLAAGAGASILRSAIMFTFLLVGDVMNKRSSIYNTLAASAFLLLCINPFSLWDVGFQLSYAAVLSILVFMKPISNWFYFKNKAISGIWQLCSVTLSAQVLTLPIVCFHFHQFPNLFLITNLLVVPASSLILYLQLGIIVTARFVAPLAKLLGYLASGMLWSMNSFIQKLNELSFVVTGGIQLSILDTLLFYACLIAAAVWLMQKKKAGLFVALATAVLFTINRSLELYGNEQHDKLIVYNIPQHTAIDFIHGMDYQFAGDTVLLYDEFLQNFHLKPARILYRTKPGTISTLAMAYPFYFYKQKTVLLIDKPFRFALPDKMDVDVILLTKNAKVNITNLANTFNCKLVVFDGSNSLWKMKQWKKECDNLHLRHYSTAEQGAFIMDL